MNKAGLILEKIARMTRAIRLKRHASAIADAVDAMLPTELLQLRSAIESVASGIDSSPSERRVQAHQTSPDVILDEVSKISVDRQLNSDSAIVRIRYIARWLTQVIHMTVGENNADIRAIHRNAVAILRRAQSTNPTQEKSWFITNDKKVS